MNAVWLWLIEIQINWWMWRCCISRRIIVRNHGKRCGESQQFYSFITHGSLPDIWRSYNMSALCALREMDSSVDVEHGNACINSKLKTKIGRMRKHVHTFYNLMNLQPSPGEERRPPRMWCSFYCHLVASANDQSESWIRFEGVLRGP